MLESRQAFGSPVVLFLFRLCQLLFASGILSMLLGTADQLFGLGIWNGRYPGGGTDAEGHRVAATYGEFMLYSGGVALVGFLLGIFAWSRLRRRYVDAVLLAEELEAHDYEEGRADLEDDKFWAGLEAEAEEDADERPSHPT